MLQFEEKILHNVSLKQMNTLNIDAKAQNFMYINDIKDLFLFSQMYKQNLQSHDVRQIFTLGEGSNTIFAQKIINAFVLKMQIKGKKIIKEDEKNVYIKCFSGELWRDFVIYACENNYSGLENLAAIYGTIGGAAVQNIGAYGEEVKNWIDSVEVFSVKDSVFITYNNKECCFGYRDSIFQHQDGGEIIYSVTFKLNKHFVFNNSYKILADAFNNCEKSSITPLQVAQKVTEIRNNKLPNPQKLGNVGSFFKNPVVSFTLYEDLKMKYPDIVAFDDANCKKISAGWLIEKCGFKGKRIGNVSMHSKQALVLVNYGVKDVEELLDFSDMIAKQIKIKFNIDLIKEPHIVM